MRRAGVIGLISMRYRSGESQCGILTIISSCSVSIGRGASLMACDACDEGACMNVYERILSASYGSNSPFCHVAIKAGSILEDY